MSSHIHSWVDGHLAVRERAYETRGGVELDGGPRWPRTTAADVIAIGGLVDPAIIKNGTPGLVRRWRAALADLPQSAAHDTYAGSREFWSSFEAVAVFLDDVAVPPPSSALWDALLDELSTYRNAGPSEDGPFVHFDGHATYDDLFEAQRTFLATKRGSDQLPPPAGFGGGTIVVPRTTNADVLQLATYWTDRLGAVKQEMGHDGIVAMWKVALADVDKIAKPGTADTVYAKNLEFWASARRVAVQVAISDEAPSRWDMAVSSVKDSVTHLPATLEHAATVIGDVAKQTGKGLLEGLGAPVLIGAGLLGLFLFSRGRHQEEV
jgi:hypothetical protein